LIIGKCGIVGKTNSGKTTFFNAATLLNAPVSPRPFTTIKPNVGIAYLRVPCVCREFNVKDSPTNSACINGTRFIPVELIDVAGLISGAWSGRGLGNRFLDEISRADVLIHVVDASGGTDEEGEIVKPSTHDPLEDVKLLDFEFAMWLKSIIKRSWDQVARIVEVTKAELALLLEEKLSGLAIDRVEISEAFKRCGLDPRKPLLWNEEDHLQFSLQLRRIAKPMVIAANKVDVPEAEENVKRLMKESPYPVVPVSAEAELILRRASEKELIEYMPGESGFKIRKPESLKSEQLRALKLIEERVLRKWKSTGVQEVLNYAYFNLLNAIVVYPVEDPEKLTDHKGNVLPEARLVPKGTTAIEMAGFIHTELAKGFLYAIDVKSKRRLGADYILKDRDVISIVSTLRRG